MRIEATSGDDFAFALEPSAPPVVSEVATHDRTLHVEFPDGISGDIRFLPTHLTGVFQVLKNPVFSRKLELNMVQSLGQVNWTSHPTQCMTQSRKAEFGCCNDKALAKLS